MEDTILQTKKSRRTRFAIFDFDWTLVKPKAGRKFPTSADDWMYLRESVPNVIHAAAKDRQIVIVTDQSKPWKIDQIEHVMEDIGVDYTAIVGVRTQKPDTALFLRQFPSFDPDKGYYVGDAAGRPGDWSDKDKEFAKALKTKFYTPEDVFPLPEQIRPKVKPSVDKEVVIMVGYPASGKSTIATSVLAHYHRADGDKLKTAKAMIKDAEQYIATQSVVFDSTAGTKAKRAEFMKFAQKHDLPVRVIWVQTPIEVAMERNKQRAAEGGPKIPDVVFYVYRKNFEEPTEIEGFTLVKIPS